MPIHDIAIAFTFAHPLLASSLALPAALLIYVLANEVVRRRARVPGMQGPRGWPLVGNLPSIRTNAAAQYSEWATEYGDVYQVQMGNEPIVIVNSARAARALWVGQSQALSGRPVTYTFHKVSFRLLGRRVVWYGAVWYGVGPPREGENRPTREFAVLADHSTSLNRSRHPRRASP